MNEFWSDVFVCRCWIEELEWLLLLRICLSVFRECQIPNLIIRWSQWCKLYVLICLCVCCCIFIFYFLFFFFFLEFIKCVCGLRWMWWNCSALCRMYGRGKVVLQEWVRQPEIIIDLPFGFPINNIISQEWLRQPGLSRAPRLDFQTQHTTSA